jgi:hypothetical protein
MKIGERPGAKAANSFSKPDTIKCGKLKGVKLSKGEASCELPPLSFAALSFSL